MPSPGTGGARCARNDDRLKREAIAVRGAIGNRDGIFKPDSPSTANHLSRDNVA